MKKLLTIAAVVLAAVCVQAATTSWDWSLLNVYAMDDSGDSGFDGFVTGSVQLVNADASGTLSADFDSDGSATGTATGTTDGAFAADAPWEAIVTVNIGGQEYKKIIDFTIPAGLTGDIQNDSGIFSSMNDSLYDNVVGSDGILMTSAMEANGWTAVPEPTSVALIALGLVAFGLKRKVA